MKSAPLEVAPNCSIIGQRLTPARGPNPIKKLRRHKHCAFVCRSLAVYWPKDHLFQDLFEQRWFAEKHFQTIFPLLKTSVCKDSNGSVFRTWNFLMFCHLWSDWHFLKASVWPAYSHIMKWIAQQIPMLWLGSSSPGTQETQSVERQL